MAGTAHEDRMKALKKAADTWFQDQKAYIEAEYDFLSSIAATRGGTDRLQNAYTKTASDILANSMNDYLGEPLRPVK